MKKIYRTKQQLGEAKIIEDENEEEQLFVILYFSTNSFTKSCFVL
jgi:hypothetical protein